MNGQHVPARAGSAAGRIHVREERTRVNVAPAVGKSGTDDRDRRVGAFGGGIAGEAALGKERVVWSPYGFHRATSAKIKGE